MSKTRHLKALALLPAVWLTSMASPVCIAAPKAAASGAQKAGKQDGTGDFEALREKLKQCYAAQDWNGAKKVFRSMIGLVEDAKGVDDPGLLSSMDNYKVLLQKLGDQHGLDVLENKRSAMQVGGDGGHSHILNLIGSEITDDDALFLIHGLERDIWDVQADGSQITDRTLQALKKANKIDHLRLGKTGVTDAGLQYVADKPLVMVLLSGTRVSDAGLAQLSKVPTLKTLGLESCNSITDKSVPVLQKMPALRYLNISHTAISAEAVAKLKQSIAQVIWSQ